MKGRSILKDLLDIENAMLLRSLDEGEDGVAIFLDFAGALPSMSQDFIHEALASAGVPQEELNFLRALYDDSHCDISMHGAIYPGFPLEAGVRQGCPLSPLVYAMAAEVLMDRIEDEAGEVFVRAYADDTALVLKDYREDAPVLAKLFKEFETISGLRLNFKKSVLIPLNAGKLPNFARTRDQVTPLWGEMPIKECCKYLGFMIGPKSGDESWTKPLQKFKDRVALWEHQPLGLHWDARVYNMFMLPTLGYIAQLKVPPEWMLQEIEDLLPRSAKGPKDWCSSHDLWHLAEGFNMSCSFKKIDTLAIAAKSRVWNWDRACQDRKGCVKDHDLIIQTYRRTDHLCNIIKWRGWYDSFFLHNLIENEKNIKEELGSRIEIITAYRPGINKQDDKREERQKKAHQSAVYQALLSRTLGNPVERFREKLGRWLLGDRSRHHSVPDNTIHATPRWQAERACWIFSRLKNLVPPRVHSAVFGTIWNRWGTTRRYQKRVIECRFGCGAQEGDSIEHYCRCGVVKEVGRKMLNINSENFVNLHGFTLTSPYINLRDTLTCIGLLIYGTYRAFNCVKHDGGSFGSAKAAYDGICQSIREGAKGHSNAIKVLNSRWIVEEGPAKTIQHQPMTPYTNKQKRFMAMADNTKRARRRIQR